ncbi:MAG: hypothetical protein ABI212_00535 [Burkholderiaceae bacterium]
MQRIHDARELKAIALRADAATRCNCPVGACTGWESVGDERWPAEQMTPLGSLRDPHVAEPTFEEQHAAGTRYESPDAPIAPAYFPYNRCDLWQCGQCHRLLLRYTEFGGYYIDHRVRTLRADLVAD